MRQELDETERLLFFFDERLLDFCAGSFQGRTSNLVRRAGMEKALKDKMLHWHTWSGHTCVCPHTPAPRLAWTALIE